MTLEEQLKLFSLAIASGFFLVFCYNVYQVIRNILKLKKTGTIIGDLLFWLILTPLVFIFLFPGNQGEIRFFIFFGLVLGALLYLKIFSQLTYSFVYRLYLVIRKLFKIVMKISHLIWTAFIFPYRVIYFVLFFPGQFIRRGFYFIIRFKRNPKGS
ncbi:MAG TPA: spore cortex biosynthesis protein YabQ [Desulfotomaculum sp.]|nr:spore cortex biosynthesis protein YabQ [Desulfotomaculum sp.]